MTHDVFPEITRRILGCAIDVHSELGPGLLESTYRDCLVHQLDLEGLSPEQEVVVPIKYKGLVIDSSYRADIIVNGKVLLELKAIERLLPIHEAQMLTYLRHTALPVGLLLNFNVRNLAQGIRRFVR